jgi:hypothetical protein
MCWKYPIILHFIRTSPMEVCSKYCMDFWRNRQWCSHCLSCVLRVLSSFITKQFWLNIVRQSSTTSCFILCYVPLLGTTSFFMSVSLLTGIFIYIFFMYRELVSYFIWRSFKALIWQNMSLILKELESQYKIVLLIYSMAQFSCVDRSYVGTMFKSFEQSFESGWIGDSCRVLLKNFSSDSLKGLIGSISPTYKLVCCRNWNIFTCILLLVL